MKKIEKQAPVIAEQIKQNKAANMVTNRQPASIEKASSVHRPKLDNSEMSTEKVYMEIKIMDKIVQFEYILKKDTPEVVARECVSDFNFDQKYISIIKDNIIKNLNLYKEQLKKH